MKTYAVRTASVDGRHWVDHTEKSHDNDDLYFMPEDRARAVIEYIGGGDLEVYEVVYVGDVEEAKVATLRKQRDDLLAACEAMVKCVGSWADWEDDAHGHVCPVCSDYSFASASDIVHRDDCEYRQANAAIAAARGNR